MAQWGGSCRYRQSKNTSRPTCITWNIWNIMSRTESGPSFCWIQMPWNKTLCILCRSCAFRQAYSGACVVYLLIAVPGWAMKFSVLWCLWSLWTYLPYFAIYFLHICTFMDIVFYWALCAPRNCCTFFYPFLSCWFGLVLYCSIGFSESQTWAGTFSSVMLPSLVPCATLAPGHQFQNESILTVLPGCFHPHM